jgi:ubiquinone/menaquinone biosynthesis C-methylase UbiE
MTNVYDKKFSRTFSMPSISNEYVNLPKIIKLLGNVKNKEILELGCGNGYWLRSLSKRGAKCTGIDISDEQLLTAKKMDSHKVISFLKRDIAKPIIVKKRYDVVLLFKVILEFKEKKKVNAIFHNAHNFLKKGGRLIILDLHPFAPTLQHTITVPKNYNYFYSGVCVKAMSTRFDGVKVYYNDHHWTFTDLSDFLSKNNFLTVKMIEHRASPALVRKFPSLKNRKDTPMDIIIEAIKK